MIRHCLYLFAILSLLFSCSSKEERQQKLINRSFALIEEGQSQKGIERAEEAIRLNAENPAAWNAKGVALYKNGDIYESVQAFDKAIALKSDYTRAYYNRSNAFYRAGEYYRALDDLEPVIEYYSDSAFVFLSKGLAEVGLKQYKQAKVSFNQAASLDDSNAEVTTNLASVYYFQDSLLTAQRLTLEALELDAEEANAWNLLSLIQTDLGELNKALESINRAVNLNKFQPYFLNNRGYIYTLMAQYDKAATDLKQSISIDEKNPYVYRNLGVLSLKKGDLLIAEKQLKDALSKNDELPLANYYMGELYRAKNDTKTACKYYRISAALSEPQGIEALSQRCTANQ